MRESRVGAHVFRMADQHEFADVSGDFNPIHIDAIAARRTQAGTPVVHGIHALLWAIEQLIASASVDAQITSLRAEFRKFIHLEQIVELRCTRRSKTALRAELFCGELSTTVLEFGFTPVPAAAPEPHMQDEVRIGVEPRILAFVDLENCAGRLRSTVEEKLVLMFPHVVRHLGRERTAAVARTSALVGMVCPGLHSMLSACDLKVVAESPQMAGLSFRTRTVDERFSMVELEVNGDGIFGTLTAFLRPQPVQPPTLKELSHLIRPGEFVKTTALVVGGSRGLGAVTAKAIAAGGGRVLLTYFVGSGDARDVASEIGTERCRLLSFDVRQDVERQLSTLEWPVTQLYYFASPHIFRQKAEWYAHERFVEFYEFYVRAFAEVFETVRRQVAGDLSVFYPSSIFVEGPPREFLEYSIAKAAGEALCANIASLPHTNMLVRRLPRVLTDQTTTVIPAENRSPLEVMLPILREMHAR